MPATHHLKTWPKYFQAILDWQKTFEIRVNDRGFKEKDTLILEEYEPESKQYTGRWKAFVIGFMVEGEFGLAPGVCCMSLLPIEEMREKKEPCPPPTVE